MFYIYINKDDPFLPFFKGMNYKLLENVPNFISKDTIIFYSLDSQHLCTNNNMINILIINDSIIDIKNTKEFKYFLPLNPNLYFKYINEFQLKLLLPINFFNDTGTNRYFIDSNLNAYTKQIKNGISSTFIDSNIVIINNNTRCLNSNSLSKHKKVFNLDQTKSKYDVFEINNYLSLCNKYKDVTIFNHNNINIINNIKIILIDNLNTPIELTKNDCYIIARKGFKLTKDIYSLHLFYNYNFNVVSLLSKGNLANELVLFVHARDNISKTFIELFEFIEYNDYRIIGKNDNPLNYIDNYTLHYYYSKNKLYHMINCMINYENYYYDIIIKYTCNANCCLTNLFHVDKFIRHFYVWVAENNYSIDKIDITNLKKFIDSNKNLFVQEQILLTGKALISYGGSQKTSLQIYNELLLSGYDVKIATIGYSNLVSKIDKNDVIYFNNIVDLEKHIHTEKYKCVIINKLDELLINIDKCISKSIFISHNSMDFVNSNLISMSKHLHKVFTVNDEHRSLLYQNHIECQVLKYINYNNSIDKINNRTNFKNRILYIGRISREKNIELLISSFTQFNTNHKNIYELLIIGDGKFNISKTENIILLGKQDYGSILFYLANSDYLIIPSSSEGCPFVILEAMNLGIPIISSNIIGCNELVREGYNGFLFNYYDYDKHRNTINNWDVIEYNLKNTEINSKALLEALNRAYSISIEEWNVLSNNAYNFVNEYYNDKTSIDKNVTHITQNNHLLLITTSNLSIKYFDTKNQYNDIDLYKYDIILHLEKFKNHDYLICLLYKIKAEMIDNRVNKLYDSNGNYIIIYLNEGRDELIHDMYDFLEMY